MSFSSSRPKSMINSIINFLPDNRPVTSLHVVEDCAKCPTNYTLINRSYDQDSDADLGKENVIIGKRYTRYLCISKSEGPPDCIIETLKIVNEKEITHHPGYSLIPRTFDSNKKSFRKKHIIYKLTKRGTIAEAITDVILCSRSKFAPDGFHLAGEINGILICYKRGPITHRSPPAVPLDNNNLDDSIELCMNRINLSLSNSLGSPPPLSPKPMQLNNERNYENLVKKSPAPLPSESSLRPAPVPPGSILSGTLNGPTGLEGIPFMLNSQLSRSNQYQLPVFDSTKLIKLDYDFALERQILCTIKTANTNNPFFK